MRIFVCTIYLSILVDSIETSRPFQVLFFKVHVFWPISFRLPKLLCQGNPHTIESLWTTIFQWFSYGFPMVFQANSVAFKFHLSLFLPPCGISCGFISLQLLQVGTWVNEPQHRAQRAPHVETWREKSDWKAIHISRTRQFDRNIHNRLGYWNKSFWW